MEQKNNDNVNHPSHYTDGKYECIDFIESWGLGFHLGNAVKYISRAGKKDKSKLIEDLEKAKWYINRYKECTGLVLHRRLDCKSIDVYDYATDKGLSFNRTMALIELVERDSSNGALAYLDMEIKILQYI